MSQGISALNAGNTSTLM